MLDFKELISIIKENWGTIVAILGLFGIGIEMTPFIKINPISWIMSKIGHMLNAEMLKELSMLKTELHDHLKADDEKEIKRIRKEIIGFALSCQRDERHTRDEFERIFSSVDEYHNLIDKHKMKNGQIDNEVKYINKVYLSCEEEHKFFEG